MDALEFVCTAEWAAERLANIHRTVIVELFGPFGHRCNGNVENYLAITARVPHRFAGFHGFLSPGKSCLKIDTARSELVATHILIIANHDGLPTPLQER
jgi:hypothetical protein